MSKLLPLLLSALLALAAGPARAETRTVTLSVPGMNCPICPLTVKKALTGVDGVRDVDVSFEQKEVRVTFDDARADVETLRRATANAGYPSTLEAP